MARPRKAKAEPVARGGIAAALVRYRRPPPGTSKGRNRLEGWITVRTVKAAIKMLVGFGQPVTPRSVADATELLAKTGRGYQKRSEKAILDNAFSRCIYDAWKTTKPTKRSRVALPRGIPRSWFDKSRDEIMVLAFDLQNRLSASEAGRKAAIRAQRQRSSDGTSRAELEDLVARMTLTASAITSKMAERDDAPES